MTYIWASLKRKGFDRVCARAALFGLLIGYDESNVFEIHYLVYPQPLGMLYSYAMVIMKAITVQGGKTGTRTWSYGATGPVARTRARVPKSQVHVSRDYIFFLHLSGSNL